MKSTETRTEGGKGGQRGRGRRMVREGGGGWRSGREGVKQVCLQSGIQQVCGEASLVLAKQTRNIGCP